MTRFDWKALLRGGLTLGLSPADVWALTPAELQLLFGPTHGAQPMGRDRLAELAAAFPDDEGDRTDG